MMGPIGSALVGCGAVACAALCGAVACAALCGAVACTPVSSSSSSSSARSTTVTGADEGRRAARDAPNAPDAPPSLAEPVRARVEHCRSTAGGKLVVRMQRAPNAKLAFDVAPGSSLDPLERKCVLEALSKLDIDESSTAWAGLNVQPTGFTSLVTVEW